MTRNLRTDSRFALAFATFVCAWALALVVLGLAASPESAATSGEPTVLAATAGR